MITQDHKKGALIGFLLAAALMIWAPILSYAARTGVMTLTGLFTSQTLSINVTPPTLTLPSAMGTGSLGGGTVIYYELTALDGNGGETSGSSLIGTTTTTGTQGLNLTYSVATGTVAVRVYYSTSTPLSMTQYFTATNTRAYNFTSTSSPTAYVPNGIPFTNSAYVVQINSNGVSWLNGGGNIGIGTTSPQAGLDIASSTVRAYSVSTSTCSGANDGAMFYHAVDKHLYICVTNVWQLIK